MRRSIRPLAVAAAVAALSLTAAGCGGDSVTIPTGEGNIQVDKDGDTFKVETKDGTVESGSKLPDNFPDDVPLVDGDLISAAAISASGDDGFVVSLECDASAAEVSAQATEQFTAAGYKEVTRMSAGTSSILGFESARWTIALSISESEPATASYTVAKTEK